MSSTTTAKNPAARTTTKARTTAKPAPKATKATTAPKEPAKAAPKKAAKPEAKTLIEALTTKQTVLLKVRANGTKRSLPYLAVGSEGRKAAEAVAARVAKRETVPAIAEDLNVSLATARRFLANLTLAHDVEAGRFDKAWKPGGKEVVTHTVTAKPGK
jgi:hypothetical protein